MGYLGGAARRHQAGAARAARAAAHTTAAATADRLLESLLDERQREDRRRYRRWWVRVDRGWLQFGVSSHDIRFRPDAEPDREVSLCVVTTDRTLPPGDIWSTLLLTATATPETFFRVANIGRPPTPTRRPIAPPVEVREVQPSGSMPSSTRT